MIVIVGNVISVTVSIVAPVTAPKLALISVVPGDTTVARPFELVAFEMVATDWLEDDHVAAAVKSCVDPSENAPVAVNCCVRPVCKLGLIGVTSIDSKTTGAAILIEN